MNLRAFVLFAASLLLASIFALDYVAGNEFSLWLLYVLPIALTTMTVGPRCGYIVALAATGLLLLVGYMVGGPHSSQAVMAVVLGSESLAFLLFVFLIGVIRTAITSSSGLIDRQLPAGQR